VVLTEGVAHAMVAMMRIVKTQQVPGSLQLQEPRLPVGFTPPAIHLLRKKLEMKPVPGLDPVDVATAKLISATIVAQGSVVGGYSEDKRCWIGSSPNIRKLCNSIGCKGA
jgi:hypothetical protein